MNDMNELTNKLQQVMVPKAALIAYEYHENRYGSGRLTSNCVPSMTGAGWRLPARHL